MSYSQFSFKSVKKRFGLIEHLRPFTHPVQPNTPSNWLLESLEAGKDMALFSEKSRSELIVSPILVETKRKFPYQIGIYSGANLDADNQLGLNGECDYVISLGEQISNFEAPVFCLVEAKDQDMELGEGQCVAQMVGARLYNKNEGKELPIIYGCATTGEVWQFLKLENDEIIIDSNRYYLAKLDELLGALFGIVNEAIQTSTIKIN